MEQLAGDLEHTKRLYKDSVEENGRLEARIQAFAINAQSEQDVLSSEVQRREDTIARLKVEHMNQTETISRHEDKVLCRILMLKVLTFGVHSDQETR